MKDPDIHVISIPGHWRRQNFINRWAGVPLLWRFFDATDGKKEGLSCPARSPRFHRPLRAGELGCVISHRRIWERYKNDPRGVVVVEDDVEPTAYTPQLLDLCRKATATATEILYLANLDGTALTNPPGQPPEVRLSPGPFWGTAAYWISPAGMRRCLALTELLDTAADWVYYDIPPEKLAYLSSAIVKAPPFGCPFYGSDTK